MNEVQGTSEANSAAAIQRMLVNLAKSNDELKELLAVEDTQGIVDYFFQHTSIPRSFEVENTLKQYLSEYNPFASEPINGLYILILLTTIGGSGVTITLLIDQLRREHPDQAIVALSSAMTVALFTLYIYLCHSLKGESSDVAVQSLNELNEKSFSDLDS
jgi:hypothetical protein